MNRYVIASVMIICVSAVLILANRRSVDRPANNATHLGSSLILSSEELATLEAAAEAGDGEAAYTIYMHYAIGLQDPQTGQGWLEQAADSGYEVAKEAIVTLNEINE